MADESGGGGRSAAALRQATAGGSRPSAAQRDGRAETAPSRAPADAPTRVRRAGTGPCRRAREPARRDLAGGGGHHRSSEEIHYGEVPAAAGYAEMPQPEFEQYYGSAGGEYGEGPPPQPYSPSIPSAGYPPPPAHHQHPPERQPAYFEPHPGPASPGYDDRPLPVHEPSQPQEPFQYQEPHSRPPTHHPQRPAGPLAGPNPSAETEVAPSGSFRDWAARLHGQVPEDASSHGHGGVS